MRIVLIAIVALLNTGCVAWQSSIDDIQASQESFRATVELALAQLPKHGEVDGLAESLEAVRDASAVAEVELAEIRQENETITRSIAAETIQALASHFGVPAGGNLAAAIIENGGAVTDSEVTTKLSKAIDEYDEKNDRDDPLSDTERGAIAGGALLLMNWLRNRKYKPGKDGSTPATKNDIMEVIRSIASGGGPSPPS